MGIPGKRPFSVFPSFPGPNCADVFTAEHAEIAEIILEAHGRGAGCPS